MFVFIHTFLPVHVSRLLQSFCVFIYIIRSIKFQDLLQNHTKPTFIFLNPFMQVILHTFTSQYFGTNLLFTSIYIFSYLLDCLPMLVLWLEFPTVLNSTSSLSSATWSTIFSHSFCICLLKGHSRVCINYFCPWGSCYWHRTGRFYCCWSCESIFEGFVRTLFLFTGCYLLEKLIV